MIFDTGAFTDNIKVIQYSSQNNAAIKPFVAEIWQNLFVVSKNEENKSVAAECVGRLTIIDPATCISGLKVRSIYFYKPCYQAALTITRKHLVTRNHQREQWSYLQFDTPSQIQLAVMMITSDLSSLTF